MAQDVLQYKNKIPEAEQPPQPTEEDKESKRTLARASPEKDSGNITGNHVRNSNYAEPSSRLAIWEGSPQGWRNVKGSCYQDRTSLLRQALISCNGDALLQIMRQNAMKYTPGRQLARTGFITLDNPARRKSGKAISRQLRLTALEGVDRAFRMYLDSPNYGVFASVDDWPDLGPVSNSGLAGLGRHGRGIPRVRLAPGTQRRPQSAIRRYPGGRQRPCPLPPGGARPFPPQPPEHRHRL